MITVSTGPNDPRQIVLLPRVIDGRLVLSKRQVAKIHDLMWTANVLSDGKFELTTEGCTPEQLFSAISETGV